MILYVHFHLTYVRLGAFSYLKAIANVRNKILTIVLDIVRNNVQPLVYIDPAALTLRSRDMFLKFL